MNHKTEFLHRDTIETSIIPLIDWYLREPDEERKLYPPLRMSHMRSMEIQKKVKAVLENARTTLGTSHLSSCFCPIFADALSSAAPTLL